MGNRLGKEIDLAMAIQTVGCNSEKGNGNGGLDERWQNGFREWEWE